MKILLALAMALAMNSTHAGMGSLKSKNLPDISHLPRAEQIRITKELMKKEHEKRDHKEDHDNCVHEVKEHETEHNDHRD
jgi:hypothetical protein